MAYSFKEGRYVHSFPRFTGSARDIMLNPSQGMELERNLLTLATSRSGKGAAQIIPNLRHWSHNALVIDPKGEAAELTWQDREAMGQQVFVLDPFETCNVPDRISAPAGVGMGNGFQTVCRNTLRDLSFSKTSVFMKEKLCFIPLYSRYSPKGGRTPPRSCGSRQILFYGVFCPVFTGMANTQNIDRLAVLQDCVNNHVLLRRIHAHGWRDLLPQTGDLGIVRYGLKGRL